jgi:hypothetical protein
LSSVNAKELFEISIECFYTEINFLKDDKLFEFGSTNFILGLISGEIWPEIDNDTISERVLFSIN